MLAFVWPKKEIHILVVLFSNDFNPPKLYVTLDSSGKDISFCQVGLFLSIGSCLIIKKIWKDRLITAQADRISQLLAHGSKYSKQQTTYSSVIAQGDRTFIKQTVDGTTPETWEQADLKGVAMIPLGFPFYASHLVGCRLWGHTESDTTEVT